MMSAKRPIEGIHYVLLYIDSAINLNEKANNIEKVKKYIKCCNKVVPVKVKYRTSYINSGKLYKFLNSKNLLLAKYVNSFNHLYNSMTLRIRYKADNELKIMKFLKNYGIMIVKDNTNINSLITTIAMMGFRVDFVPVNTIDSEYVSHYLEMGEHISNFSEMAFDGLFDKNDELFPILMCLTGQGNNFEIIPEIFQKYGQQREVREHYGEKFKDNMFYMFMENIFPPVLTRKFEKDLYYNSAKSWIHAVIDYSAVLGDDPY